MGRMNCIEKIILKQEKDLLKSNRSSIWKNYCGKWKMIFNQGTLCDKQEQRDDRI